MEQGSWIEPETIGRDLVKLANRLRTLAEQRTDMPPEVNAWLSAIANAGVGVTAYAEECKNNPAGIAVVASSRSAEDPLEGELLR